MTHGLSLASSLLIALSSVSFAGENSPASEAAAAANVADEPRPELSIEAERYNWGTAYRGERLEHTFVIKNSGTAPLIIEEVKPQCGCTLATDYEKTLAPGQSTSLQLTLETGAMTGKKEKYTEIRSNALTEKNKLWMEGEIVELLVLDPKMPRVEAVLGTSAPRPPTELHLTPNVFDRKIEVLGVKARDGKLSVELTDKTARLKTVVPANTPTYIVHMQPKLDSDDRTAFQDDAIQIQTRVDGKPLDLSFPVSIALRDRIQVSPSKSIHFSGKETEGVGVEGEDPPVKVLDVQSAGDPDHKFKILEVEKSNELFRTELETVTEGKHYRLKVFVTSGPEGKRRFIRGRFQLKTDDPQVPKITIPAMAQFARKRKK